MMLLLMMMMMILMVMTMIAFKAFVLTMSMDFIQLVFVKRFKTKENMKLPLSVIIVQRNFKTITMSYFCRSFFSLNDDDYVYSFFFFYSLKIYY